MTEQIVNDNLQEVNKKSYRLQYDPDRGIIWAFSDNPLIVSRVLERMFHRNKLKNLHTIIYRSPKVPDVISMLRGPEVHKFMFHNQKPKKKHTKRFSEMIDH